MASHATENSRKCGQRPIKWDATYTRRRVVLLDAAADADNASIYLRHCCGRRPGLVVQLLPTGRQHWIIIALHYGGGYKVMLRSVHSFVCLSRFLILSRSLDGDMRAPPFLKAFGWGQHGRLCPHHNAINEGDIACRAISCYTQSTYSLLTINRLFYFPDKKY